MDLGTTIAPPTRPSAARPDDTRKSADVMAQRAAEATALLKALAHDGRMMILCHLADGEKTVSELEELLDSRQAAVSQQLARLRAEGLVTCRREGKSRVYSVSDPRAAEVIGLLCTIF